VISYDLINYEIENIIFSHLKMRFLNVTLSKTLKGGKRGTVLSKGGKIHIKILIKISLNSCVNLRPLCTFPQIEVNLALTHYNN
jgi:hypothetical protein